MSYEDISSDTVGMPGDYPSTLPDGGGGGSVNPMAMLGKLPSFTMNDQDMSRAGGTMQTPWYQGDFIVDTGGGTKGTIRSVVPWLVMLVGFALWFKRGRK